LLYLLNVAGCIYSLFNDLNLRITCVGVTHHCGNWNSVAVPHSNTHWTA